MGNTSERTLRLLSLLQTNRFWPGAELAERLAVSERTLRRDVDRLRELGYRVAATPGVGGGYQLRAGRAMPPLLLTDEEAVAIAVGLRSAAAGSAAGYGEAAVEALTKVMDMLPPRLRRRIDALRASTAPVPPGMAGPRIDPLALLAIARACRDTERLRFDYTASGGERTARLVEPHRLVQLNGRWYLPAWDTDRGDWRTFRVDRVHDPEPTGTRFRQRELPEGDAEAFVQARLSEAPARYRVVVRVRAPAADVARTVGEWGTAEDVGGGASRLVVRTDELHWPALILLEMEADFDVEEPPEFRDYLRRVAGLFARAGSTADGG
ncbi:helix-turn-helix transcriptional regulator [Streptomonospora litoralis]|uniref:Bifunctional ligase/repressor BirA n=1 Tax=Streptomonospora litoralis TaxID=2498135 RepID=A0A4P6Q8P8_9ACTN|nr:YafY family protein [Streptomonospora litoralis]QBI55494.1 Bifunctional ligase/repressor BirA [Streptomonospora litoralis]